MLLFLGAWLAIWTGAGIANFALLSHVDAGLLAVAAGGWLLGCLIAGLLLASQLTGRELIRIRDGEIEAAH